MDHDPATEMDAALVALWDRARVSNEGRVEVIEAAFTVMRDGILDASDRVEAVRAAHSLAGSAGTFGFAGATELARAAEELLADDAPTAQSALDGLATVTRLRAALASTDPS